MKIKHKAKDGLMSSSDKATLDAISDNYATKEALEALVAINAGEDNEGKILKVVGGKAAWVNATDAEGVEI